MFRDREEGGAALARALSKYKGSDLVVYGLPRGGLVTAHVVANALGAPLDVVITRKIGHPHQPEYAVGAIAEDGQVVLNEREVAGLSHQWIEREKQEQLREAKRRRAVYVGGRAPLPVKGKTAIIVDDGIATGYTIHAAALAVRKLGPAKVVLAAPVGPPGVESRFVGVADEVVVPEQPPHFYAIGQFYERFEQLEDGDVIAILREAEAA